MIAIQYEPVKNLFRIVGKSITVWRTLIWLEGCFAFRGFPYNWQAVIDNPQQVFYL